MFFPFQVQVRISHVLRFISICDIFTDSRTNCTKECCDCTVVPTTAFRSTEKYVYVKPVEICPAGNQEEIFNACSYDHKVVNNECRER
jgi:hypothetical protein